MPEIVHSLLGAPELWVLAVLVVSLAGTALVVRRPQSYPRGSAAARTRPLPRP